MTQVPLTLQRTRKTRDATPDKSKHSVKHVGGGAFRPFDDGLPCLLSLPISQGQY